jgi:hypothetical protein
MFIATDRQQWVDQSPSRPAVINAKSTLQMCDRGRPRVWVGGTLGGLSVRVVSSRAIGSSDTFICQEPLLSLGFLVLGLRFTLGA